MDCCFCTSKFSCTSLHSLKQWSPFKIDALGLVTLLGTQSVDYAVGRLVRNPYTEWLPLLGAYTIASDQVVEPIPGFVLYNITDAIMATDLTGWFSRWLLAQDLTFATTSLTILNTRPSGAQSRSFRWILSFIIGAVTAMFLILLAVLMRDWWGLVKALSMAISVLVRQTILGENRNAVDLAVLQASNETRGPNDICTVFVAIPNDKARTIYAPRRTVQMCLLTTPRPPHIRYYRFMRFLGWVAFGCHVIALSMASLFSLILSLIVLVGASVFTVRRFGIASAILGPPWNSFVREASKIGTRECPPMSICNSVIRKKRPWFCGV